MTYVCMSMTAVAQLPANANGKIIFGSMPPFSRMNKGSLECLWMSRGPSKYVAASSVNLLCRLVLVSWRDLIGVISWISTRGP